MASSEVLDVAALLAPIPGDDPAGGDIRAEAAAQYYAIKDSRNAARSAERQAVADGDESGRADWRPVIRLGQAALAERTKDLEIAAYTIEALVRLYGFAGLRDGFRLTRGLVEHYWEGLYPRPDEDGLETRVAPLTSLNGDDSEGTLITPIAKVLITESGSSGGPFATFHYQQAVALAQVGDEETRERRIQAGAVSMPMLERAVAETPASFYADLVDDLTQAQAEYEELCRALDERCEGRAPPASNIRAALDACLDAVKAIARDKLPSAGGIEEMVESGGDVAAAADGQTAAPAGAIRNREDALQLLLKVAEYFRRAEPHTPVSYALEQAVRWGRMPLPELLADLIPDEGSRLALFSRVGIRMPE